MFFTVFTTGYFVLYEALKGFGPSLERSSQTVIKNNVKAIDKHFEMTSAKFDALDKRMDETVRQHNTELDKGTSVLLASHQHTLDIQEVLRKNIEILVTRVEAIKVLESEIIKLKHIIKRNKQ